MASLRAVPPRDQGSFTGGVKLFLSPPQLPDRLWELRGLHLVGPGSKAVKVKLKFTIEQAKKAQRRSRGIALLFLYPRR
jgi:hypothetical protein